MTKSYWSASCRLMTASFFPGVPGVGPSATADNQKGTAREAKAMLQRAAAAVDANPSAALKSLTADTDGFKKRDRYVFCAGPDGKLTAHRANSALVGKNLCGFVDRSGKRFGREMRSTANRTIKIVEYMWPRPGNTAPSHNAPYYTMARVQIGRGGFYP